METNNKLREALEALIDVIDKCDSGSPLWWHSGAKGVKPLKDARAALKTPLRNCDVGTVAGQSQRFDAFCDAHKYVGDNGAMWCSRTCPCYNDINCGVQWAQMPYEEGGAK